MTVSITPPAEVEPLENLARQANEAHRNAVKAGQSMISYAMESGSYLLAAKEQCAHGEWLPWLAENFEGSEWTARDYMRVASNRERVPDLPPETSLRGALAAIAAAKAPPEVTAEVVREDPPEDSPEILDAEVVEEGEMESASRVLANDIRLWLNHLQTKPEMDNLSDREKRHVIEGLRETADVLERKLK